MDRSRVKEFIDELVATYESETLVGTATRKLEASPASPSLHDVGRWIELPVRSLLKDSNVHYGTLPSDFATDLTTRERSAIFQGLDELYDAGEVGGVSISSFEVVDFIEAIYEVHHPKIVQISTKYFKQVHEEFGRENIPFETGNEVVQFNWIPERFGLNYIYIVDSSNVAIYSDSDTMMPPPVSYLGPLTDFAQILEDQPISLRFGRTRNPDTVLIQVAHSISKPILAFKDSACVVQPP